MGVARHGATLPRLEAGKLRPIDRLSAFRHIAGGSGARLGRLIIMAAHCLTIDSVTLMHALVKRRYIQRQTPLIASPKGS